MVSDEIRKKIVCALVLSIDLSHINACSKNIFLVLQSENVRKSKYILPDSNKNFCGIFMLIAPSVVAFTQTATNCKTHCMESKGLSDVASKTVNS